MISRRTLLAATLAGIPVGAAGGFLMRSWTGSGAAIRFLGRNDAMVTLLDTGDTRALILLGEPDVAMLDNLPQMLVIGRTRIDLVVGSHRWMTAEGIRRAIDLHDITTLALQTDSSLPPIRGAVLHETEGQTLNLDGECDVTIDLAASSADNADHPDVAISVLRREVRIVLVSGAAALSNAGRNATILAIPGDINAEALQSSTPGLFIGTSLPADYDGPAMQAHASESLDLALGNGSVTYRGDQFSS